MFEIKDYRELNALNAALQEARYHADPDSPEALGSPFVAAIHERVLQAIFHHDNWSSEQIEVWLKWENRAIEQERVRLYLSKCQWNTFSNNTKKDLVETLVRPFIATPCEIKELIEFANQHHGPSRPA